MGGDIQLDIVAHNESFRITPLFVDSAFLDIFTFTMLKGNPSTALRDVNSIVLTESSARKIFGDIDVLGEVIAMDSDPSFARLGKPLLVTGIVADPPGNSSIQFDVLLPFPFMQLSFEETNWLISYLSTFVLLHPGSDVDAVTSTFKGIFETHGRKQLGDSRYDYFGFDPQIRYGLQNMSDIHLNPMIPPDESNESGVFNGSSVRYSTAFLTVACFILAMATINFITTTLALTFRRSREVGVRKIVGGQVHQLLTQFLVESALVCLLAFLLSIGITFELLPLFNEVAGKKLAFVHIFDWKLIIYFGLALLFIIVLAGFYPAWWISRLKVVDVLTKQIKPRGRGFSSQALLILQLSIGVFVLTCALIYQAQMKFIRTKDLGYDPHNIVQLEIFGNRNREAVLTFLKNELSREPSIKVMSSGNKGRFEDITLDQRQMSAMVKRVDEDYLAVMDIPLVAGRNLSNEFAIDLQSSVMVNEALVRSAGWKDPIGQSILIRNNSDTLSSRKVVGVVKDYHFRSLHEPIMPMVLSMKTQDDGDIWIKYDQLRQSEAISALSRTYKLAAPGSVFQYNFLDESNAEEYKVEQRWLSVINFATLLATIICCSGLFGLAHLSARRRIKEVAIRKVLGASVGQLTSMMTKGFIKLVVVALIIALPLCNFIAAHWLSGFAYHIENLWTFLLLSSLIAISVSAITVGLQAATAALINPVNNLRED